MRQTHEVRMRPSSIPEAVNSNLFRFHFSGISFSCCAFDQNSATAAP